MGHSLNCSVRRFSSPSLGNRLKPVSGRRMIPKRGEPNTGYTTVGEPRPHRYTTVGEPRPIDALLWMKPRPHRYTTLGDPAPTTLC